MNTSQLSSYAPKARKAFIAAVSTQASRLGVSASGIADATQQGDVLLIGGQALPASIADAREKLAESVRSHGFEQAMEAAAYTWFNRFIAIRYMELHGYLDHGYRVLSHPDAAESQPEILDHAADIDLPSLDKQKAIELKLDGTKDEELYRLLLLAQCNALHTSMPFLFEEIGASDELLLPANLLHTDSLVRGLVEGIDQEAWEHIEIIGWLYQFYISEKKDQVIGKVVKSEDIPAATQLFTPNWIVKYMVQNSLGAQWMATHPQSPLKGLMEYYIEPAEQTDEVNAQLAAITPISLNPEELTLIDPASGSGHILVEAYDLFKAIYLERGYRQRDVPQLILEKNLYGLDIDERAAQLTGFALMMKGRADDRRLFEREVKLNLMALQNSTDFDAEGLASSIDLTPYNLTTLDFRELKDLFEHATTFGSLIQVPERLAEKLPALKLLSETTSQDLFVSETLTRLGPLVQQAELMAAQYGSVVANPPYMGGKGMNASVKKLAKKQYPDSKSDLFACFIERGYTLAIDGGLISMVTMQGWMFLSSFKDMRTKMLNDKTITTMAQIGYNSFPSMNSKVAQATVFSLANCEIKNFVGSFIDLNSAPQSADKNAVFLSHAPSNRFDVPQREFKKIPGSPIAYSVNETVRNVFGEHPIIDELFDPRQGMATGENARFVRDWFEVSFRDIGHSIPSINEAHQSTSKWFPYNKGGLYRKWFGNREHLVAFDRSNYKILKSQGNHCPSEERYFHESVSWSKVSSGTAAFRLYDGFIFDVAGCSVFGGSHQDRMAVMGLLNSTISTYLLGVLSPTLNFEVGAIKSLPVAFTGDPDGVVELVCKAKTDWDAYERSWDFQSFPLLAASSDSTSTLESSYTAWITQNRETFTEMKRLEEENNRLFIDAYGLADELTPDVPIKQITLTVNPAYRYGIKNSAEERDIRFSQDTMEELVSYAIGCMMGRYSLDADGLIMASSGETLNDYVEKIRSVKLEVGSDFDYSLEDARFIPDEDGIVPLTDTEWFDDDACNRAVEFISKSWDPAHLEENLTFLADNLSPKANESSRDTLRRYLCETFFKKHTQTYKKRPIYWLFTSGKQKAFQCLVYLHRYNEGTLARMRSEYVIPLQGKMATRLEQLTGDIASATSTAQAKRLTKEKEKLEKQRVELISFDEKLRHYADMRIDLDLDDGVKVNYGKFGDLLAKV